MVAAATATPTAKPEEMQVQRFRRALAQSDARLKTFRDNRREFIALYCGSLYGMAETVVGTRPLNQIYALITSTIPALVSANPKAWIRATKPRSSAMAGLLGERVDKWAKETKLVIRLRRLVLDGLVGPGLMWTGLAHGREMEFGDYWLDAGKIASKVVSLDDYCCDPFARHREEMFFEGHAYPLPLEFIRERVERGYYENADLVIAGGEAEGQAEKTADLSKREDRTGTDQELEPMVQLVDLWLPQERQVWTLPPESKGNLPLRVVDYDGPEAGPYDMLSFFDVPDNPFPLSPVAAIYDLDDAINIVGRKMIAQIKRAKRLGIYQHTDEEDANQMRAASDGEFIGVQNPDSIKDVQVGGASPDTFNIVGWLIQQASEAGGNIRLRGGRRTDEPTLGQTEVLAARIGDAIRYMRGQLNGCVSSVYEKVVWHVLRYEMDEVTLPLDIPGIPEPVQVRLQPEDWSELDLADLEIDVRPYSMTPDSPAEAAMKMLKFLGTVQPFLELLAAQGKALDAEAVIRKTAELLDIREIDVLLSGTAAAPVGPVPPAAQPEAGPLPGRGATTAQPSASRRAGVEAETT